MFVGFVSMRSGRDGFLIVMLKSLKASRLLAPTKRPEFTGSFDLEMDSKLSCGNLICLDYICFTLEGGNPKGKLEEVTHVCAEFFNEVQSKDEHEVFGKMPLLKKSSNTDADSMDDASEFDLPLQGLFIYGPLVDKSWCLMGMLLLGCRLGMWFWHVMDANAKKELTSKQVSMIMSSLATVGRVDTLVMHKFGVEIVECGRAEVLLITSEPHGKWKCIYSDVAWALNRGNGELSAQIYGWLFARNGRFQICGANTMSGIIAHRGWMSFLLGSQVFMLFSGGAKKRCVDAFGMQYCAVSCNGLCKYERFLMALFGLEISNFIDLDFDYHEVNVFTTSRLLKIGGDLLMVGHDMCVIWHLAVNCFVGGFFHTSFCSDKGMMMMVIMVIWSRRVGDLQMKRKSVLNNGLEIKSANLLDVVVVIRSGQVGLLLLAS